VTIWEIFSFGEMPYRGIASAELQKFVIDGNRLEKPKLCEEKLYTYKFFNVFSKLNKFKVLVVDTMLEYRSTKSSIIRSS